MNNRDEIPERARRGEPCADDGLAPLLETAARVEAAFAYNPDPARQTDALRRFNQARAELKRARAAQKPVSPRFRLPRLVWAAGLAAVALAVAGVLALRPGTVPVTYVSAETGGNLVFLLSDEENAIADFASLRLTIDRVGLLNGAGTAWIEYDQGTGVVLIHILDLVDEAAWVDLIKNRYEALLLEIFE